MRRVLTPEASGAEAHVSQKKSVRAKARTSDCPRKVKLGQYRTNATVDTTKVCIGSEILKRAGAILGERPGGQI